MYLDPTVAISAPLSGGKHWQYTDATSDSNAMCSWLFGIPAYTVDIIKIKISIHMFLPDWLTKTKTKHYKYL